ncbi:MULTISPECIES: AAA family ATPase [unclassified Pseudomonas]|uniref:AAA family ATPase n=1 Tax=unclassified Pseudomonas TaxID=196821 RepID=UPI0030DBA900
MRLDQLHIQNFRCYDEATFDFQPGFNLVVGVNGSGKTSLLQAVASSLCNFSGAMGRHEAHISDQDVRFTVQQFNDRFRYEHIYPLVLSATGSAFGLTNWKISKDRKDQSQSHNYEIHTTLSKKIDHLDSEHIFDLPLFTFYRANRRWTSAQVSPELAATQKSSRLDAYVDWFDAAVNLQNFESWFIGKTLERLQRISRSDSSRDFDDELHWVNTALKFALPDSKGIEYDLGLRTLLVHVDEQISLPFSSLSDGQRGMIALVSDIARRMCLLNPHMGSRVLENTYGIVIIDELDIHLHPGWQRSIVSALKNAFPKIQFIAASHSPQIIGGLKPGEIMLLNKRDASHPHVSYGLDSSRVLEEIMGVSEREPEIETLLSELFSTLEDNDFKKAKAQLQALKEKAPGLPEFLRAEAFLKRKEMIGR